VAYLVLLVVLHTWMSVLPANAVALTACAAVNTAVHWRTLTVVTARHVARRQLRSAGRAATASWAAGLLASTLALAVAGAVSASVVATLVAAIAANSVVSMGRFLVLRSLAYRHHLAGLTAGGHTHEWQDRTSTGRRR
jgi:hypothetical protein